MIRFICFLFLFFNLSFPLHLFSHAELAPHSALLEFNSLRLQATKCLDEQQVEQALTLFEKALAVRGIEDPDQLLECSLEVVNCLIYLQAYQKAERSLLALGEDPLLKQSQKAKIAFLKSKLYFKQDKPILALNQLYKGQEDLSYFTWPQSEAAFLYQVRKQAYQAYQAHFLEAEEAFEHELYTEALSVYQMLNDAIKRGVYQPEDAHLQDQVTLRMAQCSFGIGDFQDALALLNEKKIDHPTFCKDAQYLKLLCHKNLKEYEKAYRWAKEYLTSGPFDNPEQHLEVSYEEINLLFLTEKIGDAQALLTDFIKNLHASPIQYKSKLLMAKICLKLGQPQEVEKWLGVLPQELYKYSNIAAQWAFWRAEAFLQQNEFALAIQGYKRALEDASLDHDAILFKLAYAHYNLALDAQQAHSNFTEHLKQSQNYLEELSKQALSTEALSLFAQVLSTQVTHEISPTSLERLESLLEETNLSSKLKQDVQEFLVLNTRPLEAQKILLEKYFSNSESISFSAQLLRGQIELDAAKELNSKADLNQLALSLNALCSQLATQKVEDQNHFFELFEAVYSEKVSLTHLEEATEQLSESLENPKLQNNTQAQSTHAWLWFKRSERVDDPLIYQKAISYLESLTKEFSTSQDLRKTSYLMGVLSYQKKDYDTSKSAFKSYLELADTTQSQAEALFWLAQIEIKLGANSSEVKELYKNIYESFPASPYAPLSYFLVYSFKDYLELDQIAFDHLKEMQERFDQSPLLVLSHYLLGQIEEKKLGSSHLSVKPDQVKACYENYSMALSFVGEYSSKDYANAFALALYQEAVLRSQLALADLSLKYAHLFGAQRSYELFEEAQKLYQQVRDGCIQGLEQNLLEECHSRALLGLGRAFLKLRQVEKGESALVELVSNFGSYSPNTSKSVFKAYQELIHLNLAKKNYSAVLSYVDSAEHLADQQNNLENKLSIRLQKSLCLREQGLFDEALMVLSEVINDPSMSALRVKAMLLRAEIFELKDQKQMAQKQLKAAAEKGGEWGKIARERLVAEYGEN